MGKEEEEEVLSRVNSLSSVRGKGNNRGCYYLQRDLFLNRPRWLTHAHNASSNQSSTRSHRCVYAGYLNVATYSTDTNRVALTLFAVPASSCSLAMS